MSIDDLPKITQDRGTYYVNCHAKECEDPEIEMAFVRGRFLTEEQATEYVVLKNEKDRQCPMCMGRKNVFVSSSMSTDLVECPLCKGSGDDEFLTVIKGD